MTDGNKHEGRKDGGKMSGTEALAALGAAVEEYDEAKRVFSGVNEKWQRGREAVNELSGRLSDAGFGHDFWFNGLYGLCAERSAEGLNKAELVEAVERLRWAELRLHALGKGHLADIRFPREAAAAAEAHGLADPEAGAGKAGG